MSTLIMFQCFRTTKVVMALVSAVVIVVNTFFMLSSVLSAALLDYWILAGLVLYSVIYLSMCAYLVLHMFANMVAKETSFSKKLLRNTSWRNKDMDQWN